MLKRFAPLVPLALVTLLFGCASQGPVSQPQDQNSIAAHSASLIKPSASSVFGEEPLATEEDLEAFSSNSKPYELPVLADALMDAGCTSQRLLEHFQIPQGHFLGCWALDAVLGRE